ncbi:MULTISPECIES: hypothetical protein [Paracoccus]|uniref:hypothetical protein n=1 Tax=Paracoccus TaxID=265 RepID=UPI000869728B|nr:MULTISPECIES: hypothetical protein [Paracoccus]ODT60955.1 MAG: hypothetical protein ABS73_03715 [Paracoccus sp. SCN 68-21]
MGNKAGKQAEREARRVREDEEARQARVAEGTANINQTFDSQFTPEFFSGIADSYQNFASPQLQDQHQDANKQLTFDLARGGKLDSSTRATQGGELQKIYSLGQQQIADQALAQQNAARNSVEDARSGLISQVNATGDATGATNAARARAEALSRPAGDFSPIGDMFQGFTGQLGQRYAAERAYAASGGASRGYTPVSYGAPSGAVRVTR